jgi:hypothetical protein
MYVVVYLQSYVINVTFKKVRVPVLHTYQNRRSTSFSFDVVLVGTIFTQTKTLNPNSEPYLSRSDSMGLFIPTAMPGKEPDPEFGDKSIREIYEHAGDKAESTCTRFPFCGTRSKFLKDSC